MIRQGAGITRMSPYELRARIEREKDPQPVKGQQSVPFAVTCLALYEVAKAIAFLLIFAQVWSVHESRAAAGNHAYDPFVTEPRILLFPIAAAAFLGISWGIWRLQEWSRHAAIVVLALFALYWWRVGTQVDLIPWVFTQADFVTAVLLIELTSIAALYLLTDVTEAFDQATKTRQT